MPIYSKTIHLKKPVLMFAKRILLCFTVLFFISDLSAQTRLGLHYTQEELDIWLARIRNSPYSAAGDEQLNSPGDWARIQKNANTFMTNPSAERWKGVPTFRMRWF